MNVIEASGLGKRYGRTWALRECTLAFPAGHLTALVGPNGAGKTTLMHLSVGLAVRPPAPSPSWAAMPPGRQRRWTASRSSRRTRRHTRTFRPRTCCT
jgi:ABC-type branched-subunit amino acid transport system ATPase component